MYIHAASNNNDNYHRNWNITRIMIILIYDVDVVIPEEKKRSISICFASLVNDVEKEKLL
jgi:hypothetical protein